MGIFYPVATTLSAIRLGSRRAGAILCAMVLLSIVLPSGLHGQRLVMDDFIYPPGDSLTPHGWTSGSSTGPILTSGDGLQFGLFQGSGIGNAVVLKSTGQDVQKEFTPDTIGTFFVWMLVNVSTAKSGDYFIHLQPTAGSSVFVGRTYARLASNGGLAFGVAKRGTNTAPTVVYSDSIFALGTTYLLVLKYEARRGSSTDDQVTLYVFAGGEVPQAEPWTPTVGPVSDATPDPSMLGALTLRQGDQARAPMLTLDGLRVTRGWEACLPATLDPLGVSLSSLSPGAVLTWRAWTEVGVEGYHVDRRYPTDDRYVQVSIQAVPAAGAAGQSVEYAFVDSLVSPGAVTYRLRLLDTGGGEYAADSVDLDVPTAVREGRWREAVPLVGPDGIPEFIVSQNYANPFNPRSLIRFSSPTTQAISIDLFDILGRHCAQVFHGTVEGGRAYEVAVDATRLSTGAYVARLSWRTGVASRKLLVIR